MTGAVIEGGKEVSFAVRKEEEDGSCWVAYVNGRIVALLGAGLRRDSMFTIHFQQAVDDCGDGCDIVAMGWLCLKVIFEKHYCKKDEQKD